ncbi:hypothetical protein [Nostoc sp. 'Peltigera malacea cyanobiont' DB3992]|uniref:hypothetical protein n=1 Tax=Nostoc sp. 'Peltigera malacea cyanobiont' DB3992 TaxID=1206980 RepID=UPI000C05506F|nr:hypothetical protein [Nostoc sp. 'Peltigera malacea cyanobiont' DB3992]PHM10357.1 hypothetical protein CK516_09005 [Nostoc sp. 'Peltigera malacea cyanobiont' DB3992]
MKKDFLVSDSDSENKENIEFFCIFYVNCSQSRVITQLQQQVESLEKQIKDFYEEQETLKNQMEYCSANLNRFGISTDSESLETYKQYSCDNHYNW